MSVAILRHSRTLPWVGAVLSAVAAIVVLADRPGLEAAYHPLDPVFENPPTYRRVEPTLAFHEDLERAYFTNTGFFGVRWSGWLLIEQEGVYSFRVDSTEAARLTIDGDTLVALRDAKELISHTRRRQLAEGLHRIVIELARSNRGLDFSTSWKSPGGPRSPIPPRLLFQKRPGTAKLVLRKSLGRLKTLEKRLLAAALVGTALLLVWLERRGRQPWRWIRAASDWAARSNRQWLLELAGLAGLFVLTLSWVFPRTGSPFGYDDVRYLNISAFNQAVPWVANRYAHIYLLKPFLWLGGSDAFLGARLFWSVQLGVIVTAMAAITRDLAPRRRLATLAFGLFFLWSQPLFFLRAGAAVPDFTVATLLMIAVAIYLRRQSLEELPRWEWHIFAIGLLSLWAIKSKELGVILLWLCAAFPFEHGRFVPRLIPRKFGGWLAGVVAGLVLLAVCDGLMLGDPLFGLRPSHQRAVAGFNFADWPQQARESEGWMQVVWEGKSPVAADDASLKYLAVLVALAAVFATQRRRSIEVRLLHLTPILFLAMLILLHIRATYIFLARYLYPVIPLSCLLAAVFVYSLCLEKITRKEVSSPAFVLPATGLILVVAGIAIPYLTGWLSPEEFLPAERLAQVRWLSPDSFVRFVATPLLILSVVIAGAVLWHRRSVRLLLVATLVGLLFGVSFFRTNWELATRQARQRADSYLYPWTVFDEQIESVSGDLEILVSPNLLGPDKMFGVYENYERIALLKMLRSMNLKVRNELDPELDFAFLTDEDFKYWRRRWPGLGETATLGPNGQLVLVRPAEARLPDPRSGQVP